MNIVERRFDVDSDECQSWRKEFDIICNEQFVLFIFHNMIDIIHKYSELIIESLKVYKSSCPIQSHIKVNFSLFLFMNVSIPTVPKNILALCKESYNNNSNLYIF